MPQLSLKYKSGEEIKKSGRVLLKRPRSNQALVNVSTLSAKSILVRSTKLGRLAQPAKSRHSSFADFVFERSRKVAPLKKSKPPQSLEVGPCSAPGAIIQPFGYFRRSKPRSWCKCKYVQSANFEFVVVIHFFFTFLVALSERIKS
jgi:hypothetical protein